MANKKLQCIFYSTLNTYKLFIGDDNYEKELENLEFISLKVYNMWGNIPWQKKGDQNTIAKLNFQNIFSSLLNPYILLIGVLLLWTGFIIAKIFKLEV